MLNLPPPPPRTGPSVLASIGTVQLGGATVVASQRISGVLSDFGSSLPCGQMGSENFFTGQHVSVNYDPNFQLVTPHNSGQSATGNAAHFDSGVAQCSSPYLLHSLTLPGSAVVTSQVNVPQTHQHSTGSVGFNNNNNNTHNNSAPNSSAFMNQAHTSSPTSPFVVSGSSAQNQVQMQPQQFQFDQTSQMSQHHFRNSLAQQVELQRSTLEKILNGIAQPMPLQHMQQHHIPNQQTQHTIAQQHQQHQQQQHQQPQYVTNTSENSPCKDFLVGKCVRQQCRFLHLPPNVRPFPEDVCKDYIRGTCGRGVCRFFHGTSAEFQKLKEMHQGSFIPPIQPSLALQSTNQFGAFAPNHVPSVNSGTGHLESDTSNLAWGYAANTCKVSCTSIGSISRVNELPQMAVSSVASDEAMPSPSFGLTHHDSSESQKSFSINGAGRGASMIFRECFPKIVTGDASVPEVVLPTRDTHEIGVQAGAPLMIDACVQTTPRLSERCSLRATTKVCVSTGTDPMGERDSS